MGAQAQNSKYFANYAGVNGFLGRCLDGIDFTRSEEEIRKQLDLIIHRAENFRLQKTDGGRALASKTRPDHAEGLNRLTARIAASLTGQGCTPGNVEEVFTRKSMTGEEFKKLYLEKIS